MNHIVGFWLFICMMLLTLAFNLNLSAAPIVAGGNLPLCEAFAKAGEIVVYRCEPNYGPLVYVNSVGFMAIEP